MISVIVPLYNKEKIIERSLKSVLSQDYDDFEIVVVNDGSTDRSADIVKSIADNRVRLYEQENGGPSKARNIGVKYAKGEWIVFLDADDELLPGALKLFDSQIKKFPYCKMFGYSYIVDNGREQVEPYHIHEGFYTNCYKMYALNGYNYRTGCTLVSKDIAQKCPFKETLMRYEDLECYFRMHQFCGMYLNPAVVFKQNTSFCEASSGRSDIKEDFIGHLNFKGKSFWEKMCFYKLYLGERFLYTDQIENLYPTLKYRYDLLLMCYILKYCYASYYRDRK